MKREYRYLVLKYKDMLEYLSEQEQRQLIELAKKVDAGRERDKRGTLECVCVESDWPEYDETWQKIAARVDAAEGLTPLESRIDQIERYGTNV
jgi:hypothetical protein